MKFEKQRIGASLTGKIQLNNQEFLTFRNNPPTQNTGRTVYSQQFDYRSLEKYSPEEEIDPLRCNFKKGMRNVRSTDKYKLISQQAVSQVTDENGECLFGSQKERNEQLKGRVTLLMKSLRRAQKKQSFLDDEIASVEQTVEENSQMIQKLRNGVEELTDISEQNLSHCSVMASRIKDLEERSRELQLQCDLLNNQVNTESTTRAKDRDNPEIHIKLQQGMRELQKMAEEMNRRIAFYEQEIFSMEERLEELQVIDDRVRSIGAF